MRVHHRQPRLESPCAGLALQRDSPHEPSRVRIRRDRLQWQFYLPRLPGTANDFPGISSTRQIWFDRSVGFYGLLDTSFAEWVDNIALIPAAILVVLCVRALIAVRATLRRRIAELGVYAFMGGGLMALDRSRLVSELPRPSRNLRGAALPAAPAGAPRGCAGSERARSGAALGPSGRCADRRSVPGPRSLQPAAGDRAVLRLIADPRTWRAERW